MRALVQVDSPKEENREKASEEKNHKSCVKKQEKKITPFQIPIEYLNVRVEVVRIPVYANDT